MSTLINLNQDEPNLQFSNFTKFYTMAEDKKGANAPKINDLKKDLNVLSQQDSMKIGGGKMQTPSGATPPQ